MGGIIGLPACLLTLHGVSNVWVGRRRLNWWRNKSNRLGYHWNHQTYSIFSIYPAECDKQNIIDNRPMLRTLSHTHLDTDNRGLIGQVSRIKQNSRRLPFWNAFCWHFPPISNRFDWNLTEGIFDIPSYKRLSGCGCRHRPIQSPAHGFLLAPQWHKICTNRPHNREGSELRIS